MRSKTLTIGAIGVVIGLLLAAAGIVVAGSLNPSGPPDSTSSYTLADIYERLNAGTAGAQSTFTAPAAGPGTATMYTLNDIMGKAPALDDTNGAGVADVASGKTFWGLKSPTGWGLRTGTASLGSTYNAGVPKTGQTTLYGTGDDGDLEKGVAWPNPRFTDNSNGTVTDNLTGLIWLRNANCATGNWATALTFANSLYDGWTGDGSGGDCGLSDGSTAGQWRVPNVREIQSLLHYGFYNPAVPSTVGTTQWTQNDPFTYVSSNWYCTSTTHAGYTTRALLVHMASGNVDYPLRRKAAMCGRCVGDNDA